jgi:hypothetical protein
MPSAAKRLSGYARMAQPARVRLVALEPAGQDDQLKHGLERPHIAVLPFRLPTMWRRRPALRAPRPASALLPWPAIFYRDTPTL